MNYNDQNQMLEIGQQHLETLRQEARMVQLQPKQPSLRRRIAQVLKRLAAQLEQEPQLAHS